MALSSRSRTLFVVGAGGNIGSHLLEHLARTPGVSRLSLCDPDVYEEKNRFSQAVSAAEVGRSKVAVQAARLHRINPQLEVKRIAERVQDVPLGWLRGDALLAGLDSREARRYVNQAACRLGVPWIDAGVDASGLLARVNVYLPGPEAACLECAWDDADYAALEQVYPCQGAVVSAPTNAPSSLGALAAALQAIECKKLLDGTGTQSASGWQVLLDAQHHRVYRSTLRRNQQCRFDHRVWHIHPLVGSPGMLCVSDVLRLTGNKHATGSAALRVEGRTFVRKLTCACCGFQSPPLLCLSGRLPPALLSCVHCGQRLVAAGFDQVEWLEASALTQQEKRRSLRRLGLRRGDVLTIRGAREETHHEIGVAQCPLPPPLSSADRPVCEERGAQMAPTHWGE